MKEKERDTFDDLFRSKLENFEAEPMPGDWEAISNRLLVRKSVPFRRKLNYWAAAAVASLLMITGGVYLFNQDKERIPVAEAIQEQTAVVEDKLAQQVAEPASVAQETEATPITSTVSAPVMKKAVAQTAAKAAFRTSSKEASVILPDDVKMTKAASLFSDTIVAEDATEAAPAEEEVVVSVAAETDKTLLAVAPATEIKEKKQRRWSFGMGGGSVTAGTTNSLNAYALKNTSIKDLALMYLNSPYFNDNEAPKTNIHHKTPVTVGVGVSYWLNNRFSLQSGLNYTFLSSSWETNGGAYRSETKQKLHFLGIPLSLSYKIAEWKQIQFYAAAGGMAEVNVAGKLQSKIFSKNEEFSRENEHIRMKEWLWSVNGRVGASYPLLRFVNVYAEAGVGYYFDNGSKMETLRSDKPFNVNLQAGFRFGF